MRSPDFRFAALSISLALLGLALPACAPPPGPTTSILPLRRVRLYETGVGYFERTGALSHKRVTALPVPPGHVDDALKTLTVLAKDGRALVHGVAFPSNLSQGMARALASLPLTGTQPISFHAVLAGLKGQRVVLQTDKGELAGRPVEVRLHRPPGSGKGKAQPYYSLLLLTSRGEIRRLPLATIKAVRPTGAAARARVSAALLALSGKSGRSRRLLKLLASAQGPITLGYIAETPLWRVSYRLVQSDKQAQLQSWALVHNDSDENWRAIRLSLVSGRPDSFIYPLAVPRYSRRPLVHPLRPMPTVPQLLNTTADALWGDQLAGKSESSGAGGMGLSGTGSGGGGSGYGSGYAGGSGRLGASYRRSPVVRVGNLAALSRARGKPAGALFAYEMHRPIDLDAHASALLPFLQQAVEAETITLIRLLGKPARRGVRFRNSTNQTLPGGTIAFYGHGGFSGESFLTRTKPGERRFLEHGMDLDVEVKQDKSETREETRKLTFTGNWLSEHYLRHSTLTLAVKNRDTQERRVFLGLSIVHNAKVEGADALDYDRAKNRPLAIFKLPAQHRDTRTLKIVEGRARGRHPNDLTVKILRRLLEETALPAAQKAVLALVLKPRLEIEALDKSRQQLNRTIQRTRNDLRRLRKHLAAAGGKGVVAGPIVARMMRGEDALTALGKQGRALADKREAVQRQIVTLLKKLPAL